MVEAVIVIVWLILGGWAFRRLAAGEAVKTAGGLLVFSLLLAPFAFGAALAELKPRSKKDTSND